jgi:hypothetical protein
MAKLLYSSQAKAESKQSGTIYGSPSFERHQGKKTIYCMFLGSREEYYNEINAILGYLKQLQPAELLQ